MKMYTEEQALKEIFSAKGDKLTAVMAVYKSRWKKGLLSQKTINKILIEYNFKLIQKPLYKQTKKK